MKVTEFACEAVEELKTNIGAVNDADIDKLIEAIFEAKRIYVAAAGRSRLIISAFAMRLMHLGFNVYIVGEYVTPAAGEGDLVIFCSGSGRTKTSLVMEEKAKSIGAKVALFTIFDDSEMARNADIVVRIGGRTSKVESDTKTIQPGGNVFEQSAFITMDCIIVKLAEVGKIDITKYKRHANLE